MSEKTIEVEFHKSTTNYRKRRGYTTIITGVEALKIKALTHFGVRGTIPNPVIH